ncbi:carbohydrate ABC transporter permease [Mediterraneibacter sp. NSJ-55]|uniref:Carbohydrate ABC transporter permease n=1 Tax=Mediterraneibacter hominis TaxID=2763054 RepID=A0A923LIS4_9FIRM|nr:carbohydrate ABC transporter permease [Mediterraneibacter hominis]MBC5689587.1 carbohydrate ABC transporter permease [Mediterraneibacter hominis]
MICNNKVFRFVMGFIMFLFVAACVLPFILLIASSFTSESSLIKEGYSFIPAEFSLAAYKYIWSVKGDILRAYGISFFVTGFGTLASVVMTMLFAYPLSRKDLPGRRVLSFILFFTMLFNGGFVPTYLIYSNIFHITDTIWALIVPYLLMNAFFVIMVRTYINTNVPNEVIEAATIDGSSEIHTLVRVVVPMSKPIIGTIGLMTAIAYWNNWTNGIYFIHTKRELYGIQNYLNSVLSNISFLQSHTDPNIKITDLPSVGIRMALAVIALLPILIAYPFFQKSFAKGITVGSVKG